MTDEEAKKALGEGDWTIPAAVKGVELFTKLRDAKVFVDGVEGIDYASGNTKYSRENTAMSHFGAWSFGDRRRICCPTFSWAASRSLLTPPQGACIYSGSGAKGIWITHNGAKKMDAVKRIVQCIYQPEMIARFVEQAGMTPPLKDVPMDESKLNSLFVQWLNMPAEVAMTPDDFMPPKVQPDFARVSQEAFTPGTTAEKILADLTALYEANK